MYSNWRHLNGIWCEGIMELTEKQQQLLDYLTGRMDEEGRIPTLRQAAADLGVSHTAVAQLITQLEKKGVLERDGHYSRTVRLYPGADGTTPPERGRVVPIIGDIRAGLPMYAQQEWAGTVVIDNEVFQGDNLFCLRVKGESMRDAGILDGDLVVCEPRQYAENGEVVAALIKGEEATVKRFFLFSDHIELHPANDAFPVLCYPFSEILVQGKVVGVLRGKHALFDNKRR
jgi:repressor LexA